MKSSELSSSVVVEPAAVSSTGSSMASPSGPTGAAPAGAPAGAAAPSGAGAAAGAAAGAPAALRRDRRAGAVWAACAAGSGTAASAPPSAARARAGGASASGLAAARAGPLLAGAVLLVTVLRVEAVAAAVRPVAGRVPRPGGGRGVGESSMTVTPESLSVRSTRLPCEAGSPASANAALISFACR